MNVGMEQLRRDSGQALLARPAPVAMVLVMVRRGERVVADLLPFGRM